MKNLEFFENLKARSGFDSNLVDTALSLSDKIYSQELCNLFFESQTPKIIKNNSLFFEDSFYPVEFFDKAKTILSKNGILFETGFLYIYILLLERSYEIFKGLSLNGEVFFDTAKSICASARHFHKESGFFGLYDYIWMANHVRGALMRLGSFEYQICKYFADTPISSGLRKLYPEDLCIKMHVPFECDFSKSARLDSYKKAGKIFGKDMFLICDSWLLYPENAKSLPNFSNIKSFGADFEIVSVNENFCYEDLHRIFGTKCDFSDISSLPSDTLLQRIYIERIKKGLPTGSAMGFRLL